MAEEDYTMLRVTKETKEELDRQRKLPQGTITVNDYLAYLLRENKKRGKINGKANII